MSLADVFKAKISLLCSRSSAKHNITVSGVQGIRTWLVLWMSLTIIVHGTENKTFIEKDNPHTKGCRNM